MMSKITEICDISASFIYLFLMGMQGRGRFGTLINKQLKCKCSDMQYLLSAWSMEGWWYIDQFI